MSRSNLSLYAVAMAIFGVAVLTGNPPWGAVTGISILLTAAAMAAGALAGKSSPELQVDLPQPLGQKIPAGLVTLSATAILAVYIAGYQRTRAAEVQFDTQAARHQSAAPAAVVSPLTPLESVTASTAAVQTPAAPRHKAVAVKPPTAEVPQATTRPDSAPPPATSAARHRGPGDQPSAEGAATETTTQASYKDGTFLGWGRCRHGSIQASVAIEGGRIVSTSITECLTRYSCSWIATLPGQVVTRQSAKVDYVSGATESTDAFYDAVSSALASARE